jgi:putative peptide maturation system protein
MTTATPLEDALVGALRVLDDLARRHLTADDARRDLAALGRRHDLRLRLISDEEPFDGSVHHDVLVRGAGQPTVSLSLAAGPGLPWPLRGMSRSNEFDLVEVDGEKTTVAQAVACLDAVFDDVRLMRTVVDSALVDQEIDRLGLELTADELQAATEAYRRARCLYTAEDTAAWLTDRGLTPALFARQVEQHALVAKLRGHVAGPGVAAWLDAHAADLGIVVAAWATGPVERLRAEPVAAVAAAWRDGGRGGLEQWRIGELPAGFAALRTAAVGDLLEVDGGAAHALVVDRRAPDTDGEGTALAERALFADWLAGRRAAARITWYWGDRRQTDRLDDARR